MRILNVFKKIPSISVMGTAFLSVLLVLPFTENFIGDTKNYLLFFSSILVILFFVIKSFKEKAIKITVHPISGVILFFGLATLLSIFFTSSYPVESLLGMGGVYVAAAIISLLGGSLLPKNYISKFIYGMTVTSMILVITVGLQMIGFGPAQLINKLLGANLTTTMIFNLTGSPFIAAQVIFITLVGIGSDILLRRKLNKFYTIALPVLLIGLTTFIFSLLPGKETSLILPPLNMSWSIALDTIKNPKSALIGAGPSSYTNVYNNFRPVWVNNMENWSSVFSQASNFPLTLLSTMGSIGLIAWLFFVVKFVKFRKIALSSSKPIVCMISATILLQFLLPVNVTLLTIQAVAISLLIANEKHRSPLLKLKSLRIEILNQKAANLPLYISVGAGLLGSVTLLVMVGQAYRANIVMTKSSKELANGNLVKTYELQQQAVTLNPYLDTIRRRYASTNTIIAVALSNKADITDQERSQVSSLLQQSVREAKTATTLDSHESQNWVNLAQIYENMIEVSEDAAQWAVQAYIIAIENDPSNPTLRISLAELFSKQGNYQQAINILSQAINMKPDLAASHYNLALVLERLDQPDAYRQARISYQRALVLLDPGSEEYIVVNKKIEETEFTMKEKGISIEPEQEAEVQNETQEDDSNQIPSITEQNLEDKAQSEEDVKLNTEIETKLSEEL